jgi:hypothetical protein
MGKATSLEKEIELVGSNFIKAMEPTERENRFSEYLFNRFGTNIPRESVHSFNAQFDHLPCDKKQYKIRKMNPDENKYYIHRVCSFNELYTRK